MMKRRTFLTIFGFGFISLGFIYFKSTFNHFIKISNKNLNNSNQEDEIIKRIKNNFSYLNLEANGLREYVKEYLKICGF